MLIGSYFYVFNLMESCCEVTDEVEKLENKYCKDIDKKTFLQKNKKKFKKVLSYFKKIR